MPEKEKFDCKDILLIVITCLLIIAVIAMCVFVSSYAIMNQRANISDVNTSESCIVSQSLEREIADNYAMPDSNIVYYDYEVYYYTYASIDYFYTNGDVFFDEVITFDSLVAEFSDFDNIPQYFQPTAIVYNLNVSLWGIDDAQQQLPGTSIIVGGVESNSIYSYSSYTYELSYSWQSAEPYTRLYRNSIFSAGDSISISARIEDQFDFYQGMEFEIEYEIVVTRVYGYNLTSFIENEKDNSYSDGYFDGEEDGYNDGYDVGNADGLETGYETGYDEGHDVGYDEGYDVGNADGYTEGYNVGYPAGYNDGYPIGVNIGKQEGKAEGYAEGKADGLTEGYETGYDEGYDIGYDEGYDIGYDAGVDSLDSLVQGAYTEGYDDGYDVGYEAGVDYGYTSGYTDGFHDGEYEGASSAGDYSFFALVSAVFDAPLKVLIGEWQQDTNGEWQLVGGMLNFVIPGLDVNFAPLLTSLFTISLLLFLLRFILGVVL